MSYWFSLQDFLKKLVKELTVSHRNNHSENFQSNLTVHISKYVKEQKEAFHTHFKYKFEINIFYVLHSFVCVL